MSELRRGTCWGYASIVGCAYTLGLVACSGKVGDEPFVRTERDLSAEEASGTAEGASGTAEGASSSGESASSSSEVASDPAAGADTAAASSGGVAGSAQNALHSGADCDGLLEQFQANLLEQVKQRAAEARQQRRYYLGSSEATDTGVPVVTSPDEASLSGLNAGSLVSGASLGFSDTTVQVPGVDEADFVKAVGDRIYLLHGPQLYVLGADSDSTEILGSTAIEGEALDLFVHEGKVAVFSRLSGTVPGTDDSTYQYYYYYYPYYTKLTVLDVEGDTPDVLREMIQKSES